MEERWARGRIVKVGYSISSLYFPLSIQPLGVCYTPQHCPERVGHSPRPPETPILWEVLQVNLFGEGGPGSDALDQSNHSLSQLGNWKIWLKIIGIGMTTIYFFLFFLNALENLSGVSL